MTMTKTKTFAALAIALLLTACGTNDPVADASAEPSASPAESADAAAQTEAVYGDEAAVAIEAEPAADHGHEHNVDGSHVEGDEHAH